MVDGGPSRSAVPAPCSVFARVTVFRALKRRICAQNKANLTRKLRTRHRATAESTLRLNGGMIQKNGMTVRPYFVVVNRQGQARGDRIKVVVGADGGATGRAGGGSNRLIRVIHPRRHPFSPNTGRRVLNVRYRKK